MHWNLTVLESANAARASDVELEDCEPELLVQYHSVVLDLSLLLASASETWLLSRTTVVWL